MKKELRNYQKEALECIIQSFKENNRQIVVYYTNIVMSWLIAHTQELLHQIQNTIYKECVLNKSSIYVSKNKIRENVTICSFQQAIMSKTLERFKEENFELLIIDECHRAACIGYRKIIHQLGFEKKNLIGFTATPFRTDGQLLHQIFGKTSYELNILEMIDSGYLVDLEGYKVKTNISLKGIERKRGDFSSSQLESVINTKNRNDIIVKSYLDLAKGEKAVAFCAGINHSNELKECFEENGIVCESLHGKIPKQRRKEIISAFKDGGITVLTNCNLLTEGFDEPSISTLLMCRPTTSKTLYIQMIGRGARLYPGKEKCKIIEFTDNAFNICSMSDLVESNGRIKMRDRESLKEYKDRVKKELEEIATSTVIEKYEIINKLKVGDYHKGFKIQRELYRDTNRKDYFIIVHECGSIYTCPKNKIMEVENCIFCSMIKSQKTNCIKIEKIFDNITLFFGCICGKIKSSEISKDLSLFDALKNSKECRCKDGGS